MDSDDSDIFVEYQLKPVNKLTKRDGLKIKNRVLRQTKLTFERSPVKNKEILNQNNENAPKSTPEPSSSSKKGNSVQNVSKSARTSRSLTPRAKRRKTTSTVSSQTEPSPQKTIVDYFSDNTTPEKHSIPTGTKSGSSSVGRISVRNDLVINLDVSITAGGEKGKQTCSFTRVLPTATPIIPLQVSYCEEKPQEDTVSSSPKTINDYFNILGSNTPTKRNETKTEKNFKSPVTDKSDDDIEVITLSPGIKRRKKRFKSIVDITKNSKSESTEKVKRHLFPAPSLEAACSQPQATSSSFTTTIPKTDESTTDDRKVNFDVSDINNHLDAYILGVIIEDVMKHQLHLKEDAMTCGGGGAVHHSLITDFDMAVIEKFLCMDRNSQKLFMRIFFRKPGWHRVSSIKNYSDLSDGLEKEIIALKSVHLINTDIEKENVRCQLELLKSDELAKLSKSFSVSSGTGGSLRKDDLLDALLTETRVQKSVLDLFKRAKSSRLEMVGRETQRLLGPCFQIDPECRQTIERIVLLFSLPLDVDEEAKRASSMRFLMHRVLTATVTFVPFDVIPVVIFHTRADFLEYESALRLRQEMEEAQQPKNHDEFTATARKSREAFQRLVADDR